MTARSVFALGTLAALLISGDAFAQVVDRGKLPRGWTMKPNYDASRRSGEEMVPMLATRDSQPKQRPVSETVSLHELQHEVPGKALKEWDRAEKARLKGELDRAVAHLRKAIEIDPEFVAARNNLAAILISRGSSDDAIAHLEESVKLDPHNPLPTGNLAVAYMVRQMFEDSERLARRAIDLDRTSTRMKMILGLALVMRNQFTDEALRLLQRAAQDFPQAELLTARIHAGRGEQALAKAAIERYVATGDQTAMHIAKNWMEILNSGPQQQPSSDVTRASR
jgi:tetratricopeptide (TPR) repeat protein